MENKEQAVVLFNELRNNALQYIYDLGMIKIREEELDCFCYSILVACVFKYQVAEQARIIAEYFTELIIDKYSLAFMVKLKGRYSLYQQYLTLYFAHQKTRANLDPALTMGFMLIGLIAEKTKLDHIDVIELTLALHKIIFQAMKVTKKNKLPDTQDIFMQAIH